LRRFEEATFRGAAAVPDGRPIQLRSPGKWHLANLRLHKIIGKARHLAA
jgi:hypothetical protein